ncbi:tRNA 2-thiouridine(34) synthase MnmA [Candidatus Berkelbacteria bacterium CG10_big_fil_rev_8_21_14_0_10_43_13]|uniref:tRNA-specific 2-thiouridylase MnmA n=1 Tax=Candidatus Berkelbacteria bacterium CG10_big_fil_rev_8_21_14_0_10_43_13 TaxID=1974514 RepID=A0A2H0W7I0_9BACT|nr:MAG: tRNA 2-thiouridine(34) synthase MnmA [Candidatus Berkelbacteria bacterium CG10_big_fil_rev_8_21_14_0_10_43_13]
MKQQKVKVAVGMSGGVDSSVSALLLKQAGFEVVGLFMKLWHDPCGPEGAPFGGTKQNACCDDKALADAHLVADKIGIPLYEVDARREFKKEVTDCFIDEYQNIRTPNPCVVCNKKIKFGWLLDFAKKIGCDYLVTGHYARIEKVASTEALVPSTRNSELGTCHLLKGIDDTKDQSYFLYQLNQEQLAHIIFPVGGMIKSEVRQIAKENDLPVFEKAESQEVCFVSDNDYRKFLKRNFRGPSTEYRVPSPFESGDIVDKKGNVIGRHDGLVNYTVGQRKGIDQVASTESRVPRKPLYVIGFNLEKNELIVGDDRDLFKKEFEIEDAHWTSDKFKVEGKKLKVKIRYKADEISCEVSPLIPETSRRNSRQAKYVIRLSAPARAVTPGQSAVFYDGDEVVGGGIII